jgi:hypothetical protein
MFTLLLLVLVFLVISLVDWTWIKSKFYSYDTELIKQILEDYSKSK